MYITEVAERRSHMIPNEIYETAATFLNQPVKPAPEVEITDSKHLKTKPVGKSGTGNKCKSNDEHSYEGTEFDANV